MPEPILRQMELEKTVMLPDFPGVVRATAGELGRGPSVCQLCPSYSPAMGNN